MRNNSTFNHIKNIVLLPVNVTIVIPYLIYNFISDLAILNSTVWLFILGAIFTLFGIMLLGQTIFLFKTKGQGTLAPWNPTQRLVVEGPYRYVRNPMIVGVLCILIGESFMINSIGILIWGMVFFMINSLYFQFLEEPKLERRFGNRYTNYKDNVPRWIPRRRPYEA